MMISDEKQFSLYMKLSTIQRKIRLNKIINFFNLHKVFFIHFFPIHLVYENLKCKIP